MQKALQPCEKGFTILYIILVVLIAMLTALYFGFCYYETDKANIELKECIDVKNKELKNCQAIYDDDKNIYWRGNSAYINQNNKPLKKILDINSLIIYRQNGYE